MKLIVGLGNPALRQAQGKDKYSGSRHNLGFMVVEELGKKLDGGGWKVGVEDRKWKLDKKFKAEILNLGDILLVKPQTYMNNSGMAVKLIMDYYQLPINNLIVVHDDLDLLLGKIKVRTGGAAAGHHGVESIIDTIGDSFTRVRVGIGNEKSHLGEHQRQHFNAEHFVLEPFMPNEKSTLKHATKQAILALTELIGLE